MMAYCTRMPEFRMLTPVNTGEDAFQSLRTGVVDILLLDTVLPGTIDSLRLLDMISTLPISPPMIFITTSFIDDELLYEFQQRGALYCFAKPLKNFVSVLRRIQMLTDIPSAQSRKQYIQDQYAPYSKESQLREITRQIRSLGVPAHLYGYHYLRSAISLVVNASDPAGVTMTKDVYPAVAKEHNTKPALVERSIRNAIEVAWTRGNTDTLYDFFGYTIDDKKGKPTNAEFITMVADRVRLMAIPACHPNDSRE